MSWTKPVADRIQMDVNGVEPTDRGTVNAVDLNRIGSNTHYLASMAAMKTSAKTGYQAGDFLYPGDLNQLAGELAPVYAAWPVLYPADSGEWYSLQLPDTIPIHWRQYNAIEGIQYRMKQIAEPVYATVYCGEAFAGEF